MNYVYESALDLAKYVVTKCVKDSMPITNYRLQMVLYLIQLAMMRETGDFAFCDDIEAWSFGPVVPDVYYSMCSSGALPILDSFKRVIEPQGRAKAIVDRVIEDTQSLPSYELFKEISGEESPWEITYDKGNKEIISLSMMFRYVRPFDNNSVIASV